MFSAAIVTRVPERAARQAIQMARDIAGSTDHGGATATTVTAKIVPPAYTREGPRGRFRTRIAIEALQGSRLESLCPRWRRLAASIRIRCARFPRIGDTTAVDLPLVRSGYVAIEPADSTSGGTRRLLPIAVIPDRAPAIRVEKPGKDLLLPDATPVVGVAATAADDFGLQSLELRYTKVSGSGEQFEFKEGTLPLSISRDSAARLEGASQSGALSHRPCAGRRDDLPDCRDVTSGLVTPASHLPIRFSSKWPGRDRSPLQGSSCRPIGSDTRSASR